MAKKVNKNLIGGLTAVGMIAMITVAIVLISSLKTSDPSVFIRQAEEKKQEEKWANALKLYFQAFKVSRPKNATFLVEAGRMYLELEKAEEAMATWRRALQVDPESEEAQKEVIELSLELYGNRGSAPTWTRVQEDAERLLEINPSSALGHFALGRALIGLRRQDPGNYDRGVEELEEAYNLDPKNAQYAAFLATRWEIADEPRLDEAENIYKTLIETDPQNTEAMRYYSSFLGRRERPDEQLAILKRAVDVASDDTDNHVALGGYYLQKQDLDNAKREFEIAIEIDPDSYVGYEALGRLYRRKDPPEPKKAIEVYEQRLKRPSRFEGFFGARNRRSRFVLLHDAVEACLEQVDDIDASETTPEQKKEQKDELLAQAESYLENSISQIGRENSATRLLRGRIRTIQGRVREAIDEFERADEASSRPNFETKYRLAVLYLSEGQDGAAYDAARAAVDLRGDFAPCWALLARLEYRRGNYTQAIKFAQAALEKDPSNENPWLIIADCKRAQNLPEEAEAIVREHTLGGEVTIDDLMRMEILARRKDPPDYAEAERLLNEAWTLDPGNTKIAERMFTLLRTAGRDEDLLAYTTKLADDYADNKNFQLLKIYAHETDPDKVAEAMLELISKEPDELTRELSYVNFYQKREEYDKAIEHLRIAEKLKPQEPAIIEGLFNLYLLQEQYDKAETYAAKSASLNIDGGEGDFHYGKLYLAKGENDKAIEKLKSALQRHPSDSQAHVQLGFAYEKVGRRQDARSSYQTAVDLNPNNGRAHLLLAKLADEIGDARLLAVNLAECERLDVDNDWVREKIQEALEAKNPDEGIARREALLADNPDDTENLTRLAGLYLQKGVKLARAGDIKNSNAAVIKSDEYINRLLELKPNDLRVVYNVARLWRRSQRPEEIARAEALINDYIDAAEDDRAKAQGYYMLARHYREMLLQQPSKETLANADKAFEAAGEVMFDDQIAAEVGNWFQESGGIMGSIESKNKRLEKAVEWYGKAFDLAENPNRKQELERLRIDVLFSLRELEPIQEAVDEFRKNHPDDAKGLLYLSEVRKMQGKLDEAQEALTLYIEREPNDAVAYFQRGSILYRQNLFNRAIDDLAKAKSLSPEGFEFVHRTRLARCLEQAGEPERAIFELKSILDNYPAERINRNDRLKDQINNVAIKLFGLFGRLNRWNEQEALILQFMDRFPQDPTWPLRRGINGEKQNDNSKAVLGYRDSIKISQSVGNQAVGIEALDRLLRVFNEVGKEVDVINTVNNLIEKNIDTPPALMRKAHALLATNRREEAIETYDRAIRNSASDFRAFSSVAIDMKKSLGEEGVIEACRERINNNPNDDVQKFLLATFLFTSDNDDPKADEAAKKEAKDILSNLYNNAKAKGEVGVQLRCLQPLSNITYDLKQYDEAKTNFETILSLCEQQGAGGLRSVAYLHGLNNLAYLLAVDLNKPEQALPYAEKAFDILPENANILDTYGWVLKQLGKHELAVAHLSLATETDPENIPAHYHLAEAYLSMDKKQDARRSLERAKPLAEAANDQDMLAKIDNAMKRAGGG